MNNLPLKDDNLDNHILCVDDDANILSAYQRSLRKSFSLVTAQGGEEALALLSDQRYAVILTDMSMPGMNGLEFLAQARDLSPGSVCLMLTGNADMETAVDALNSGYIFRFLSKPCSPENLSLNLQAALDQYALLHAEKELLEKTLQGSVKMLMEILALISPDLFGRAQTLRMQTRTLAQTLKAGDLWKLELAALLSQIGLVTLPPFVLHKMQARQALTEAERLLVQRVPRISHNLIVNIPRLKSVAEIVLYSKKNYDGSGSPDQELHGDSLPIGSRILHVLQDLSDAQAGHLSSAAALAMMQRRCGVYDPKVLAAAVNCFAQPSKQAKPQRPLGHRVSVSQLKPGMILSADVMTSGGTLLISAGYQLTDTLLERIQNFISVAGIQEPIWVESAEHQARAA